MSINTVLSRHRSRFPATTTWALQNTHDNTDIDIFNSIQYDLFKQQTNKQYNLRLYKLAIHIMLFEGNTQEVKNL